ncbi:sulfite exporter TauE/SafE family protein, partial [Leptospira sp. SA-E8]|uniref:urease accessory protein UreH domain-containing protein n=1 Tax=Leptospira sp. SA-E8 TaxID=3422259 RepID=UPI003EB8AB22
EQGARRLWRGVRARLPGPGRGGGADSAAVLLIGVACALLPCGLLYSALLVATLTGQAWQGGAVMALFALGTAVSMTLGPWLWLRLSHSARMQTLGVRLAGLTLALSSGWALWMGLVHDTAPWCVVA